MTPSVASAWVMMPPSWIRGSMSLSVWPLMLSIIWPTLSVPVASAGEPLSMRLTRIWNGGSTRSIPMPTGPKCSMGVRAAVSTGAVLKSGKSL